MKETAELYKWDRKNKPIPPPHSFKVRTVKEYAKKFSTRILVETGTYLGDMVNATQNAFFQIFSIEIDPTLCIRARERFSRLKHISILQGDSSEVLPVVLAHIKEPCLFWLDGHYSGGIRAECKLDTPIRQELEQILSHPVDGHVMLIDDARCFLGSDGYPTIEELRTFISMRRPDLTVEVKNDIIRVHKKLGLADERS